MAQGKAHKVEIGDGVSTADETNPHPLFAPKVNTYKVEAESGLYKNGKQYDQGSEVDLPEAEGQLHEGIGEVSLVREGEDPSKQSEESDEAEDE